MIRTYADCLTVECNYCGTELYVGHTAPTDLEDEAFCNEHHPYCCECGADLANQKRFAADDAFDGGYRCARCSRDQIVRELMCLVEIDYSLHVQQFAIATGIISDSADDLSGDGRRPNGPRDAQRHEGPNTTAAE